MFEQVQKAVVDLARFSKLVKTKAFAVRAAAAILPPAPPAFLLPNSLAPGYFSGVCY